ncbi:MAG: hypothetical protein HY819_13660 [Acidobacteria bacterium]|nr:hypothetical protein [Acidobacteriota bacterium]
MVDCSNKNINLFFKYVKGELTRKEEYSIDRHLQSCEDCLLNFAYVEEIYTKKHLLSSDEKTLFIKYLSDPVWNSEIERVKKEIKSEINQEIKQQVINELVITQKEISKNEANLTSTKFQPIDFDTINSNKKNKINKSFGSISSKSKYLAAAASIVVFAGLSTSIYLMLNKTTNQSQQLSVTTPPSILINSNTGNLVDNINKFSSNKPAKNNLYQELDLAIDEYLEHQNISSIKKAREIATKIDNKYGDKYGVDLVKYYKSVPSEVLKKLFVTRKNLTELTNLSTGDDYKQRLATSQSLEKEFLSFGNLIEAYKTKTITNKLHIQLHNDEMAKIATQEGLYFSTSHKYLLLETEFLLWQAKHFSEIPDLIIAEKSFLRVIELGNSLEINKLVISAGTSLAFLYYNQNENQKSFEITKLLMTKVTNYKSSQGVNLLQLAGLTSFNLKYYSLANFYLKEAIKKSHEINSPAFTSRSYAFLALTLSEQKRFDEASSLYAKAELEASKIKDNTARLEAVAWITGYKAKQKLLENKHSQAIELYETKLSIMNKMHLINTLEFSQSNQAIAIALKAMGEKEQAEKYSAIARNYQKIADANNQKANCLLALVPTSCALE